MVKSDQRNEARFDMEVSAEVYAPNAVLQANTRNLSDSGVCLDIKEALNEGSVVGISLFFTSDGIEDPDSEALNLKADVIWCTERDDFGYSIGANFSAYLDEDHKIRLKELLDAIGSAHK
jgi:hypothetical protein